MKDKKPTAIAVGMFDGVHIGHSELLRHTARLARERGLQSVAYTFLNHPRAVFDTAPDMLMSADERRSAILNTGIDMVCMDEFTKATASLSPLEFMRSLMDRFDIKLMLAGFNYTFGYKGEGNTHTLEQYSQSFGFDVAIEKPVSFGGEPVSSTRIRASLVVARMDCARAMLGYYYSLTGEVQGNKRIGSLLGFPTANISPPEAKALPKSGVYASIANISGERLAAVTNIGNNPTVSGDKTSIETHILEYSGDLYGKRLTVELVDYLREERLFASKEELAAQIRRDVQNAAKICKNTLLIN